MVIIIAQNYGIAARNGECSGNCGSIKIGVFSGSFIFNYPFFIYSEVISVVAITKGKRISARCYLFISTVIKNKLCVIGIKPVLIGSSAYFFY